MKRTSRFSIAILACATLLAAGCKKSSPGLERVGRMVKVDSLTHVNLNAVKVIRGVIELRLRQRKTYEGGRGSVMGNGSVRSYPLSDEGLKQVAAFLNNFDAELPKLEAELNKQPQTNMGKLTSTKNQLTVMAYIRLDDVMLQPVSIEQDCSQLNVPAAVAELEAAVALHRAYLEAVP